MLIVPPSSVLKHAGLTIKSPSIHTALNALLWGTCRWTVRHEARQCAQASGRVCSRLGPMGWVHHAVLFVFTLVKTTINSWNVEVARCHKVTAVRLDLLGGSLIDALGVLRRQVQTAHVNEITVVSARRSGLLARLQLARLAASGCLAEFCVPGKFSFPEPRSNYPQVKCWWSRTRWAISAGILK